VRDSGVGRRRVVERYRKIETINTANKQYPHNGSATSGEEVKNDMSCARKLC
jgi:hypothetical protein